MSDDVDEADDVDVVQGDFDDISRALTLHPIDLRRLLDPAVVRVVAGLLLAITVVVWPRRSDTLLVVIVAALLAFVSIQVLVASLRLDDKDIFSALAAAGGLVVAVVLLQEPSRAIVVVGRIAALVIAVFALADLVRGLRRCRTHGDPVSWPVAKFVALLTIAASLAAYPSQLLAMITSAAAALWALIAVLTIVETLTAPEGEHWDRRKTRHLVIDWLRDRPKTADDRRTLYSKILYEGPDLGRRVARFVTLMTFAAVIATMGVLNDSTAVVIGAMLIAPLMTPLMGIAISVVMGWPNRLTRSALIALVGVVLTIAISYLLTRMAPATFDPTTNGQIISRSTPTVVDLIIATAAGAAGAYGLSRPDVSDALPGVAVAISLVPPLSVIGIAYAEEEWAAGNGALLLFTTNALAIVIIGGVTFVLTGVTPLRQVAENQQRVRTATASVVALAGIVITGLVLNGAEITANAFETGTVRRVAQGWADEAAAFDLVETRVDGKRVTVVLIGPPSGAPSAEELHASLQNELGRDVVTDVRIVLQERELVGDTPDGGG